MLIQYEKCSLKLELDGELRVFDEDLDDHLVLGRFEGDGTFKPAGWIAWTEEDEASMALKLWASYYGEEEMASQLSQKEWPRKAVRYLEDHPQEPVPALEALFPLPLEALGVKRRHENEEGEALHGVYAVDQEVMIINRGMVLERRTCPSWAEVQGDWSNLVHDDHGENWKDITGSPEGFEEEMLQALEEGRRQMVSLYLPTRRRALAVAENLEALEGVELRVFPHRHDEEQFRILAWKSGSVAEHLSAVKPEASEAWGRLEASWEDLTMESYLLDSADEDWCKKVTLGLLSGHPLPWALATPETDPAQ